MNLQKVRKTPAEDMEDRDIVLGRREAALSLSPWSWNRSEQGKKAPGGNMPGAGWRDRQNYDGRAPVSGTSQTMLSNTRVAPWYSTGVRSISVRFSTGLSLLRCKTVRS